MLTWMVNNQPLPANRAGPAVVHQRSFIGLLRRTCHRRWLYGIFLLFLPVALTSCSVKLVADYDPAGFEEIIRVGRRVDLFYGFLLEKPEKERTYAAFADHYVELEADIRSLLIRNQARPLNQESVKILEDILSLWKKVKNRHQQLNAYKTGIASFDRVDLGEQFSLAASGELAKKMAVPARTTVTTNK